jgi:cyclopropane fatty-acyl-phospholipid synthase-like methyltransferase
MNSSEFYDNFISYQIKSGINDRIFNLYKRLCKIGLSHDTHILEIGCGIGTLTYLISRKVRQGLITAVDISPLSIEYAKIHLPRPNIFFYSAGILEFEPGITHFDKILLFDVLEHIPENDHENLFVKISNWMNENSLLLVNIPNPNYILYDRKHNPQALQETDQPIFTDRLASVLAMASLEIGYLETYSIWVKNDYQFLIIKKRKEFVEQLVSTERNFMEKLKGRLSREFRKLVYRYPIKIKK